MPGGDRTGPRGLGPLTGRGAGYCAGNDRPGYLSGGGRWQHGIGEGRPLGLGMANRFRGRGGGGRGGGWYWRTEGRPWDAGPVKLPGLNEPMTRGDLPALQSRLEELEAELSELQRILRGPAAGPTREEDQ